MKIASLVALAGVTNAVTLKEASQATNLAQVGAEHCYTGCHGGYYPYYGYGYRSCGYYPYYGGCSGWGHHGCGHHHHHHGCGCQKCCHTTCCY